MRSYSPATGIVVDHSDRGNDSPSVNSELCRLRGHTFNPEHSHSIELTPIALYRAQYECRHCLERFAATENIERQGMLYPAPALIEHNCTPSIIGVADLQYFVKQ